MEAARGPRRKKDPDGAIAEWRALVGARWTLVDTREIGGRRYILACQNENVGPRIASLTARERQVAVFAAMGYSHKLIAYHLGIGDSTSRVLLGRAMTKLGLASRDQLIALFAKPPSESA
jgi:DNA-binding CsgD family transcriptional regulator